MNSLVALFTGLLLWLSPAESDSRFTKYKISSACTSYNNTTTSFTDVTNLSVTIKTTGRPVVIGFMSDGTAANSSVAGYRNGSSTWDSTGIFKLLRDSTEIARNRLSANIDATGSLYNMIPPAALNHLDVPAAGTYVYKLQGAAATSSKAEVAGVKMYVYELP